MKKVFFLLLAVLFLTGCGQKGELIKIDFEGYNNKIESEDSFVLVVGKQDCNFCLAYLEVLEQVFEEYDVKIYYIDTSDFTEEEKNRFLSRIKFDDNTIATPTTVYIENGFEKSTYDRIVGNRPKSIVVEYLQKKGLIKDESK